jgi:hypothetical protein
MVTLIFAILGILLVFIIIIAITFFAMIKRADFRLDNLYLDDTIDEKILLEDDLFEK